jgi:hypothetical protein
MSRKNINFLVTYRKLFVKQSKSCRSILSFRFLLENFYRAIGRLETERLEAEASFSVLCTSACFTFAAPSLSCHQIAIGLAMAIVE